MKGATSVDVRADVNTVYDLMSSHAELSKISDMVVKVKMRSERPESAVNEETILLSGKIYKCMVKHIFEIPSAHTFTVIGGDAKGSRITERFQDITSGTRINMDIQWKDGLFGFRNKNILREYTALLHDVKSHLEC